MEKIEIQKKLEKRKAYYICVIIFLGLFIPTFLTATSRYGIAIYVQAGFFTGIICIMAILFVKIQRIEEKLK